MVEDLLDLLKKNLIIEHDEDDSLLESYLASALSYATGYQHKPYDFYDNIPMSEATKQAVIMLASHFYESRDGSTGGFFADKTSASEQVWNSVRNLLTMDKDWLV